MNALHRGARQMYKRIKNNANMVPTANIIF